MKVDLTRFAAMADRVALRNMVASPDDARATGVTIFNHRWLMSYGKPPTWATRIELSPRSDWFFGTATLRRQRGGRQGSTRRPKKRIVSPAPVFNWWRRYT
jgi:hypothetical protein